jgi:MOSC domain-containing protein YiiM
MSPLRSLPSGCPACGFDPAEWNAEDTENTIRLGPSLRRLWADGADPASFGALLAGASAPSTGASSHEAVHALWHDLLEIARRRNDAGVAVEAQHGLLEQISASGGGVPKLAVDAAEIGRRGVIGDRQHTRRHHGRPWQALCVWSADVIDALVAEGHPIASGAAGENLTVRGIEWGALRAGAVLEIGEVRCQLSAPAMPCTKNNQWFSTRDSSRMDHGLHPGWSRWYASVLRPGRVAVGDAVTVS